MKNKRGDAMLVVVCVLAIFMALCLSVLLAVGSAASSANSIVPEEQSRVWAISLSDQLERLLAEEDSSLCAYIQENLFLPNGTIRWPYYSAGETGHGANDAKRVFSLTGGLPEDLTATVTLYWEPNLEDGTEGWENVLLAVEVSCTYHSRTSVIRSDYLSNNDEGSSWYLSWRE